MFAMSVPARAQEASVDPGADEAAPVATRAASGARVFTPADFERFAPRNALDMLNRVPGFTLRGEDGQRGLGQASANVVIDGERIASKSDGVFAQLQRIPTDRVVRIEIVDGASLGIPGLSGQVANVITRAGDISGRFEYHASARPEYGEPTFLGAEVSLTGSNDRFEWTVAAGNGTGTGGAGGGEAFLYDGDGVLLEQRYPESLYKGNFPRVSGTAKYTTGGGTLINANASYDREYSDFTEEEYRDLVTGIDRLRLFHNRYRAWSYELGGDIDFALAGGRLKLIGLERYTRGRSTNDSTLDFDDGSPDTGNRFVTRAETGERIGRAEYRWDMLGGGWQIDAEAAFNRYSRKAQLFDLDAGGDYVDVPFPGASGGVTEDRYETILTHNRSLAGNLTLQIGAGLEHSTLSQSGPQGLTRSFLRPKGSVNLAWKVNDRLDLSLEIARRVGQLSFGDFLASVSLQQGQQNAGNVELVPQQSWEAQVEAARDLGRWGSTNLRLYARLIEDYIELIPVEGGLETRGNIDRATLYGLRWNTTLNLDPLGFAGAKLDILAQAEESSLDDPLTGLPRAFSSIEDRELDVTLRHDIPGSDWAWTAGFQYNHTLPYYRLGEFGREYEGPTYTFASIENKDVFGMTAKLTVFNLTDGRARSERLIYGGYRDRTGLLLREVRNQAVGPIFMFELSGDF
ncbi:TonB-dependent receptor plug domain-containing protein [Aurantiacibacter spongiae]|nr:TonB-dependent receptor plug domain-containing protein [Aurantiacibacter spongiae]